MKHHHLLIGYTFAAAVLGLLFPLRSDNFSMTSAAAEEKQEETDLQYEDIPLYSFRVSNLSPMVDTKLDYVDVWYDERTDCRYLFLPATADRRRLKISFSADGPLMLGDEEMVSGLTTAVFAKNDSFDITIGQKDCGTLKVMQSTLGCAYLDLESGSTDLIDKKRINSDSGSILIMDAESQIQYDGALKKISGHGNSSYDYSRKKPYNIHLEEKADLFGMGAAKKWVLLSNFLDQSMMRNTVALELGRRCGLDYTMDSAYIDLFANGSYCGTYQLYEKMQVQKNRVNIRNLEEKTEDMNTIDLSALKRKLKGEKLKPGSYHYYEVPNEPADLTGGYLLQLQLPGRISKSDFITSRGICVEITSPEYASEAQVCYIRSLVQDFEDAVFSPTGCNGKGRHYSCYADMDSLSVAYLVEELTMNSDCLSTSFYFYKNSDSKGDGKLHFGPIWDFDLAFSNFSRNVTDPDGFQHHSRDYKGIFARYAPAATADPNGKGMASAVGQSWIYALYQHPEFAFRTSELYLKRMDACVDDMISTEQKEDALIQNTREMLLPSAEMNNARWHMCGEKSKPLGPFNGNNYTECVEYIRKFLAERQENLQKLIADEAVDASQQKVIRLMDHTNLERYSEENQKKITALAADVQKHLQKEKKTEALQEIWQSFESQISDVPKLELPGDFDDNDEVDYLDAQAVLLYYVDMLSENQVSVTRTQMCNGDVDKNDVLDAQDATYILQYCLAVSIGEQYTFPIRTEEATT
ncbi:MAG: CotH kinase family protein [Oscillospiraceae bacterium]|nr:CotH kinase family protein [Oscillospiraceae bacterium]